MTKLATMGTSSCATIALQGFQDHEEDLNNTYLEQPDNFKAPDKGVSWFYQQILYPTIQDLGRTDNYPFDALMKEIEQHPKLNKKFTIATINDYQENRGYWPERFSYWGFKKIHVTKNSIGEMLNHIYVRDLNEVIEDGD